MPLIKIERIVSFTSEDPIHTANNILSKDTGKKWKCKVAGEKSASVVLQLDQPYVISGIDIGNEHSAYIEVLISRSSLPDDYKVLLVMSSFMTPLEARQGQHVNKVRMFKQEDLSEPERNEKWDRVMIVCTQPFNRHVQYGLSFINLYTSDKLEHPRQPLIGNFILRPNSPDNISTGSLFARRKEINNSSSDQILKGAAAIREATSLAQVVSSSIKHKLKHSPLNPNTQFSDITDKDDSPKPRNRNELLYSKEEDDEHEEFSKFEKKSNEKVETNKGDLLSKDGAKKRDEYGKIEIYKNQDKNVTAEVYSKTQKGDKNKLQNESNKRKHANKGKHSQKTYEKKVIRKPFARLLEDVVIVISGIQNPERASLRSMALSMGAKYKTDWDGTCTHLICAFANTPKFNQVKGKGKIIKKNWLNDCYNKKTRFPWRRYALDNADKGIESEEEIYEQENIENSDKLDTDDEMKEDGSDTENKIEQIKKKTRTSPTETCHTGSENELVNDCSHNNLQIIHDLKNFFANKLFYVDVDGFDVQTEKKIKQYIVAYQGVLVDSLQAALSIIVTNKSNYKDLKDLCSNAVCIAPDWIWECHNCQKSVSMDDYIFDS